MMLLTVFTLSTSLCSSSSGGVLDDLQTELGTFEPEYVRYQDDGLVVGGSHFKRSDSASLFIQSATFTTADQRIQKRVQFSRQNSAGPRGSGTSLPGNSGFSGTPLGDFVGKTMDPTSGALVFHAGAETVSVDATLTYEGINVGGRVQWRKGDSATDQALIEDVVRRVLGRMLAWQHFVEVRNGSVGANATDLADGNGKRFVSLPDWASGQRLSATAERKTGYRFTYRGQPVHVVTGADRIKVGSEWVPIGGYVMEINNKPFVPRDGFLSALP